MNAAPTLCCDDDSQRRDHARKSQKNGFDYVEVSCEQTELAVYFLGKAPGWEITPKHLRLDGGRRVRDIRILEVHVDRGDDEDVDDIMRVMVDRPGDFSTYTLCIEGVDAETGRPTGRAPEDFDPRYACVCFSFKASCPNDLDCAPAASCDPEPRIEPAIDYLAKDYATFRRLMLDRMALLMPEWKERHIPDLGITLVELLAYVGDQLSYYQDAVATEAYLDTARLRISVRRHLRLVDYHLHEGCNARTWMAIEVSQAEVQIDPHTFYFTTGNVGSDDSVLSEERLPKTEPIPWRVFEPLVPAGTTSVRFREAHNRISFYTWGEEECCIPKGATSATLLDPGLEGEYTLNLAVCDVLIFEEVLGARTAAKADADKNHRHAVTLTKVTRSRDTLTGALVVEIEWCQEDALPFPLCLSIVGPPPKCERIPDVTVVRGNVILVDHGRSVCEDLCPVGDIPVPEKCPDECNPVEIENVPARYRPKLKQVDVTHAVALEGCSCASLQLVQDCHQAVPQVWLTSAADNSQWSPQRDLLGSDPNDAHFVVEVDDDRVSHLRFGDGDCGSHPGAGTKLRACYRVGGGPAGNVGADVITRIILRGQRTGDGFISARNPLPARGGTAPESVAEAKLRAPFALRNRLERAITADDYAAIVMREFPAQVQRATAVMRWNGIGPDVLVAVDAAGKETPDEALLNRIWRRLQSYRRIGHDVHVVPARLVPLDLALTVCVKPGYLRGHVKAAVLAALGNRRLPGGKPAFFHPDSLTFGESIYVSRIVGVVQAIEGVDSVVVTRLERLGEGPYGEIEEGLLKLDALEVAQLDGDPNFPEAGTLTLTMGGGR